MYAHERFPPGVWELHMSDGSSERLLLDGQIEAYDLAEQIRSGRGLIGFGKHHKWINVEQVVWFVRVGDL